MIVADLSPRELDRRLGGPGLALRTGPFVARINTDIAVVVEGIRSLYADHAVVDPCAFADWNVAMVRPWNAFSSTTMAGASMFFLWP